MIHGNVRILVNHLFICQNPTGFTFAVLVSTRGTTHLSTSALWVGFVMAAMYCMMYLLASVFPAPLSPEITKHREVTTLMTDQDRCISFLSFPFYLLA